MYYVEIPAIASIIDVMKTTVWGESGFPARLLGPSRSLCPSGISSTLGAEAFLGGLGFGSDLGLVLPGFVNRRRSPGFSSTGVDGGLLAGSYLPLNLAGSGQRNAEQESCAHFHAWWCRRQPAWTIQRQPERRRIRGMSPE